MIWDPDDEGYDCEDCPDDDRVLRHCTKGLRRPELYEDLLKECPSGCPAEPDDLCPVLRVEGWPLDLAQDALYLRNTGLGEVYALPAKLYGLVARADQLHRKYEAERIKAQAKNKGGSQ